MRLLEVYHDGELMLHAYQIIVARMVHPDDEISAQQALSVMALEAQRRSGRQGPIMKAVEAEFGKVETLGRMAGDVALAMINEHARGRVPSLEYTSHFIAHFYNSQQTLEQKYPTDVRRLKDHVRSLKDSLHLWAAWQLCQKLPREDFDFVRKPEHTKLFLKQVGLVQISLSRIPYFHDWNPWRVPKEIIQFIRDERLNLKIEAETDFEREFRETYRSRQGQ